MVVEPYRPTPAAVTAPSTAVAASDPTMQPIGVAHSATPPGIRTQASTASVRAPPPAASPQQLLPVPPLPAPPPTVFDTPCNRNHCIIITAALCVPAQIMGRVGLTGGTWKSMFGLPAGAEASRRAAAAALEAARAARDDAADAWAGVCKAQASAHGSRACAVRMHGIFGFWLMCVSTWRVACPRACCWSSTGRCVC